MDLLLLERVNWDDCIDGILPNTGVRVFLGVEYAEPESLNEVTEALKLLLRKLESILTGDAGLELFAFSPLT